MGNEITTLLDASLKFRYSRVVLLTCRFPDASKVNKLIIPALEKQVSVTEVPVCRDYNVDA
jgi:hypothetical protein